MYNIQLRQVPAITALPTVSLSSFPRNLKVRASKSDIAEFEFDYTK